LAEVVFVGIRGAVYPTLPPATGNYDGMIVATHGTISDTL